jgi:hypothetical protein
MSVHEFFQHLAATPPSWQHEDGITARDQGQIYYLISGLDAARLEALRIYVLNLDEPTVATAAESNTSEKVT